ncbi:hypothetical protein C8Q76DRAFT_802495 [Earliella scabrosa]|nr:hypothetical protein C8Q76DRAFT_802495 [Earliella scabrosa]
MDTKTSDEEDGETHDELSRPSPKSAAEHRKASKHTKSPQASTKTTTQNDSESGGSESDSGTEGRDEEEAASGDDVGEEADNNEDLEKLEKNTRALKAHKQFGLTTTRGPPAMKILVAHLSQKCMDIEWRDDVHSPSESGSKRKHRWKGSIDEHAESSPSDSGDADADSDSGTDSGNDSIELVLRKRGGRIKLKSQHCRVHQVAKWAIEDVLNGVCLTNVFPDGHEKFNEVAKPALIRGAKELKYEDMARCLKNDEAYVEKLAGIPVQRISNFCSNIKKVTNAVAGTAFNLHPGNVAKVDWLKEGIRLIYLHDFENDTVNGSQPFASPIFTQLLQNAFFKNTSAYGYRLVKHFVSSQPDKPDKKEIPPAMLSLIVAALAASIDDYKSPVYKAGKFEANNVLAIYCQSMLELSKLKQPRKYHNTLHWLYKEVCGWSVTGGALQSKSFLNTDDVDNE